MEICLLKNIRNSDLKWDHFVLRGPVPRDKLRVVLRPEPQRVPQRARASRSAGDVIPDFHTSWVTGRLGLTVITV